MHHSERCLIIQDGRAGWILRARRHAQLFHSLFGVQDVRGDGHGLSHTHAYTQVNMHMHMHTFPISLQLGHGLLGSRSSTTCPGQLRERDQVRERESKEGGDAE